MQNSHASSKMNGGIFNSSQPIGRNSCKAQRAHRELRFTPYGVSIKDYLREFVKTRRLCNYCCSAVNLSTKDKSRSEENKSQEKDHCTCSPDLTSNSTMVTNPAPVQNEVNHRQDRVKTENDSVAVYNISVNDSLITNVNLFVSISKDGVRSQYKINSPYELIRFFTTEVMGLGNAKLNSITDKNRVNIRPKPSQGSNEVILRPMPPLIPLRPRAV